MNVIVFTGPTLSPTEAARVIEAECRPPVAQGDVYRAALLHPQVIAIIDGYFERVPSVWHKEILWAMGQGIHVFGSASMGALRAAELAPFGMIGVGAIFEAYRDGTLEDDDEVAVLHGPPSVNYRAGSAAMVNIRATLTKAMANGIVPGQTCEVLLRTAKALPYPERSWPHLLEIGFAQALPDIDGLRDWLPGNEVNQKREDALAMLRAIGELLAGNPGLKQVSYQFEETLHWEELVRASHDGTGDGEVTADAIVLDELRHDADALARAEAAAVGWWLASEQARGEGFVVEAAAVLEESREFCSRNHLLDCDAVAAWRKTNPSADLDRLLTKRALLRHAQGLAPGAVAACLLDYLHWSGDYTMLLERARSARKPGP